MTLITMPTDGIRSIDWTMPEWAGFTVQSGWTGAQTVGHIGGPRNGWQATLEFTERWIATLQPWRAFMGAMRGPVNTTVITMVEVPQTTIMTNGAFNGAALAGATVFSVKSLPASQTILPAGAIITAVLGSGSAALIQPLILMSPLVSNGSGIATATVDNPLRFACPDGTNILLRLPYALMRLVTPSGGYSVRPGAIYSPTSLQFREAY